MITLTPLEMKALCSSQLFTGYSAVALAILLDEIGARKKTFVNNEVLISEGDPAVSMLIILSGCVYVNGPVMAQGTPLIHNLLSEGGVIGVTMVDSSRRCHPVSVVTHGKGALAEISLAKVRALQKAGCEVRFFSNLRNYLSEQLIVCWQKCTILSCPTIAERVMLYLRYRAWETGSNEIRIPSTEGAFANYLGVNRSALSRVLGKMAKEGRFTSRRNVFTLPEESTAPALRGGYLPKPEAEPRSDRKMIGLNVGQ